jgi:hypothetical protein
MSQRTVERVLGKLATDPAFCARFFQNPAGATWEAGLPVSPVELEALSTVSEAAVAHFSRSLDPRIVRLCVGEPDAHRPTDLMGGDDAGTEAGT